jgi:hypothetical protein
MSGPSPGDVRAVITQFLNGKLTQQARAPLSNLPDDYDLLLSGALDSLAFVEMMTSMGECFDWDVDLADLDFERVTVVGPLCIFVSEQLRERS